MNNSEAINMQLRPRMYGKSTLVTNVAREQEEAFNKGAMAVRTEVYKTFPEHHSLRVSLIGQIVNDVILTTQLPEEKEA